MDLKKMMQENPDRKLELIELRDLKVVSKNRFECAYDIYYKKKKETAKIFVEYPEDVDINNDKCKKLLSVACAAQLINLTMVSDDVVFGIQKDEAFNLDFNDKFFLNDLHHQVNRTFRYKFKEFKDLNKSIPTDYGIADINDYKINKSQSFITSMGGGKESTLSYSVLKQLNYNVMPLFLDRGNFSTSQMIHDALPFSPVIKTNLFELFGYVSEKWGESNLFLSIVAILEAPYCYSKGIDNLVFGNEYDCTIPVEFEGETFYSSNFDQSTIFERKITKYFKSLGMKQQVFSILYNLTESAVQKLLLDNDTFKLAVYQMSCIHSKPDNSTVFNGVVLRKPCLKCDKCKRICLIMEAVEKRLILGYTTELLNSENPHLIFNSNPGSGSHEAETLAYLIRGKLGVVGKINPVWHEDTFSLNIDELHPLILPDDIHKFLRYKLLSIRLELMNQRPFFGNKERL